MLVQGPDGKMRRLFAAASLSVLAGMMEANGESSDHIWEQTEVWHVSEPVLDRWLDLAAEGLAGAILSAATLLELDTVLIDGWMPAWVRARVVAATQEAFLRQDLSGIAPPTLREGTLGPQARSLGAAAIPLSQRYLIDQNVAAREA